MRRTSIQGMGDKWSLMGVRRECSLQRRRFTSAALNYSAEPSRYGAGLTASSKQSGSFAPMAIRRSSKTLIVGCAVAGAIAGCPTAPPPPMVVPAAFTPLGLQRALSLRRRDRRARRRAPRRCARAKIKPLSPAAAAAYMADLDASCSAPDRRHRPRRASGRRQHRHPDSGSPDLRRRERGGETAVRRDAARDRADGEDPQPDLCRRARPHRHVRHAAGQPGAVGQASCRGRDLSRGTRRQQGADRIARAWRERAALRSRDATKPRRRQTAGSRSGWCRTAASAARRRTSAAVRLLPPRRSRRARRDDDGRSVARRFARRG